MKTRSKIVLMLVSIFFLLILMFSIFIYVFISRYAFTDFYERLETRSYSMAKIEIDRHSDRELIQKFKVEYLQRLPEERHYILEVKDPALLHDLALRNNLDPSLLSEIYAEGKGTYRNQSVLYCGIKYPHAGKTYLVITSARNYYFNRYMDYLRNLLIISIAASSLLILLIAYWVSKRLITPIRQITRKVNEIGTENLNTRLDSGYNGDEMAELTRTFNNMLDRLETSFETQNNFISNASHELNTPLTSIIGEADVALSRVRSVEEYIEALQNILEEAEKLDKKTKALLFLAQTAFNGKALKFAEIRIDQLLMDVMGTIQRIYPQNKVHIDFSSLPENPERLKISGNEQLLHLAISNIVLNACKYSTAEVTVSLTFSDTHLFILVRDHGIGIPEQEIKYIYDPFFRASNTGNYEGYGIGLPLTRNIIKLHHGEMLVMSQENAGTTVEIKLPASGLSL